MLLILALVLFVGLVIIHEYGHFIAARKSGVDVEEFGLGFPPKVWGKKLRSGLLFSVNLLPIGGFVRLKGENDSSTEKGSYGAASLKNKVKIMMAGVAANLLVAIGVLTILAVIGTPKLIDNQFSVAGDTNVAERKVFVAVVSDDSPAQKAGLQSGDQIISVAPDKVDGTVSSPEELSRATKDYSGQEINIGVKRGGEYQVLSAKLRSDSEIKKAEKQGKEIGYLGVTPSSYELVKSTWSAPVVAVGETVQFTWLTLKGVAVAIGNVFSGNGSKAAEQVAGPVGIFVILRDGTLLGYRFVLMIIALISLTLAIMNTLPIPALDGGRLFVTLVFRAMKKPLTKQKEELIHGIGFMLLMALFVLITVVDVKRFF